MCITFAALLFVTVHLSLQTAYAFDPPTIPLNWSTLYPCAVDTGSRIIAGDVTTQYSDNTPATCIERCDAAGFNYAGVEYSDECHCGTGLKSTPVVAPDTDCDMACTGDPDLSCGGSFRIQVRPPLPPRVYESRSHDRVCRFTSLLRSRRARGPGRGATSTRPTRRRSRAQSCT